MLLSYNRSLWYHRILYLLVAVALVAVVYKTYMSSLRIQKYHQAVNDLELGRLVLAEEGFRKAAANTSLQYKTKEIEELLVQLQPVSQIIDMLKQVEEELRVSDDEERVAEMLDVFAKYNQLIGEYSAKGDSSTLIFQEAIVYYEINERFTATLSDHYKRVTKGLQSQLNKKAFAEEQNLKELLLLHNAIAKNDPKQAAEDLALLESYENARLNAVLKEKGFADALAETARINKIYADSGLSFPLIATRTEDYAKDQLQQLFDQNKIVEYIAMAQAFQSSPDWAPILVNVPGVIAKAISVWIKQADQAVAAGQFDQGIGILTKLGTYTDTAPRIRNAEVRAMEADPARLLLRAAPGRSFNSTASFQSQAGAQSVVLGLDKNTIGLARLFGDGTVGYSEGVLDEGITVKSLTLAQALSAQGQPLVLVDGASGSRQHRYLAYELQGNALRKIWDVQADRYQVERPGVLLVDNTIDGPGQQSYYEYQGGRYNFTRIKPDYIEISLNNLRNYRNTKVRFTCQILTADGNTAVVSLNGEYVILSGNFSFKPGNAVVTGKWIGDSEIKKGTQSIYAFQVEVSALSQ
ncbi:hypothetical protein [Paenibacillus koleovorans]|uniref:hypothetical protein n=1 Tax=Paenibacillus koleovorans TaxID=121608 RepID=UPI000FDB0A39|nr:hypothetical protein [Paenibacillus koleovorans]